MLFLPVCSFRLNITSKTTHCEGDTQRQGEIVYMQTDTRHSLIALHLEQDTLLESITANRITDS